MVLAGGIDIGSRTAKGVVMEGDLVLGHAICFTGADVKKVAATVMAKVVEGLGLSIEDMGYIVATGYGRVLVPFAHEMVSEITCHTRGVHWYFPSVRTILDMGGQDCKAISCDAEGGVSKFVMNERCAGGTGRFLDLIARVFAVSLEDLGPMSLRSLKPAKISSTCALFAKSEAIALVRKGETKEDIIAGILDSLSSRTVNLLRQIPIEKDFSITGGISKNIGMVARLKEKIGMEPLIAPEPVITGAIGAALIAAERCSVGHTR